MTNNDVVDRNKILGSATQDFGFDKVLRGYDIKQVNEYISNLLATNKNAGELFDQRFEELKNSKAMLEYELSQSKGEVEKLTKLLEDVRAQRDTLQAQETSKGANLDTSVVEEYQAKIDSLISKNRLLGEENKKLEDKNRDLQRDVAHLTKKVDKNRTEIKSLREEIESGMTNEADKKYTEIARIYESAIDKAEDLIYRPQTELSLAHSKVEDVGETNE